MSIRENYVWLSVPPLGCAGLSDAFNEHGNTLPATYAGSSNAIATLLLIAQHGVNIAGKTESNIASICSLVANGVGVGLINPLTAHDMNTNGGLSIKPFRPAFKYRFGLVYKQNWSENRLIELLKNNLPDLTKYTQMGH